MKKKLELKREHIDYLVSQPETGMGYHLVDIQLKGGQVLKRIVVVNSTFLLLEADENITSNEIVNIEVIKRVNN